jgi:hypothetical protein
MYTETFGGILYSQAGDPSIILPAYDTQKNISKGIIAGVVRNYYKNMPIR